VVPVAYGLFAFAVGVAAGILIRRTVPAMAVTLVVYLGVAIAMPLWIRQHLMPLSHATPALDVTNIHGLMIGGPDRRLTVLGDVDVTGWVVDRERGHPPAKSTRRRAPRGPAWAQEAGPRSPRAPRALAVARGAAGARGTRT
jgi:hypothetical protein